MDSTKLGVWFTFAAVVIGACVSVCRADNPALPLKLTTAQRAALAVALGAVQTCLMAIVSGTPWIQAVGTAIASVIVAFGASGAPRVVTGIALFLVLSTGVSGCKTLFPNGVKSVLDDASMLCIIANAAFPNATIKTVCRIEGDIADVEQSIEAVASVERAKLKAEHEAGVFEGLRRAGALPPLSPAGK